MSIFDREQNHWKAWNNENQQRATFYTVYDYLRNGERSRISSGKRVMQMLIDPSFEPTVSYEIFITSHRNLQTKSLTDKFHLLRTIWNTGSDSALAFRQNLSEDDRKNYQPNFEYHYAIISRSIIDSLFSDMQKKIPIWFSTSVEYDYWGRDGTNYELALGDSLIGIRYRWWSEKPDAWKPLYAVVDKAVSAFENILSNPINK